MPAFDADLVIVGSGPAGASTALHLARRAPSLVGRVLLLERAKHPRHKPCAGGVMPDGERVLASLGLDLGEVPSVDVARMHLLWEGRGCTLRGLDGAPAFRVVRRHELDAWLAGKVREKGFRIEEETHVRSARATGDGVELSTDRGIVRARAVVGADGSSSVVRRAVVPANGTGVARTVEVLTRPSSRSFPDGACTGKDAYMEFGRIAAGLGGYSWSFPTQDGGAPRRTFGTFDSRLAGAPGAGPLPPVLGAELARRGYQLADHEIEGHPLRWFEPGAPLSAPGMLLAGDAAGVCALFGEGIAPALGYGELAADAIASAFERGDFSFAGYGRAVAKSALGRSLARRNALARLIYGLRSRRLQALMWRRGGAAIEAVVQRLVFNWAP